MEDSEFNCSFRFLGSFCSYLVVNINYVTDYIQQLLNFEISKYVRQITNSELQNFYSSPHIKRLTREWCLTKTE